MTGYSENKNRTQHHPSFGSVVSKLRSGQSDIPPFVSLRGMSTGNEPGYLGVAHRAFSPDGPGLNNLMLKRGMTIEGMDDKKSLLASFDTVRRDIDKGTTMAGLDAFTGRAFDMIATGQRSQGARPQARRSAGRAIAIAASSSSSRPGD